MLSSATLQLYACERIDDTSILLASPDVHCGSASHLGWALTVGLPSLLVFVLGFPIGLIAWYLRRHRHQLQTPQMQATFGFLYSGFRNERYYWEAVVVMRKVALAAISVFAISAQGSTQLLTAAGVLVLSYVLHEQLRPYPLQSAPDRIASWSLLTTSLTAYGGLFVSSLADESSKTVFGVGVIILNVAFFGFSLWHLATQLRTKVVSFKNRRRGPGAPTDAAVGEVELRSLAQDNSDGDETAGTVYTDPAGFTGYQLSDRTRRRLSVLNPLPKKGPIMAGAARRSSTSSGDGGAAEAPPTSPVRSTLQDVHDALAQPVSDTDGTVRVTWNPLRPHQAAPRPVRR